MNVFQNSNSTLIQDPRSHLRAQGYAATYFQHWDWSLALKIISYILLKAQGDSVALCQAFYFIITLLPWKADFIARLWEPPWHSMASDSGAGESHCPGVAITQTSVSGDQTPAGGPLCFPLPHKQFTFQPLLHFYHSATTIRKMSLPACFQMHNRSSH